MNCRVCDKPDSEKPICFRLEAWCSDNHRKIVTGEKEPNHLELTTMDQGLFKEISGAEKLDRFY